MPTTDSPSSTRALVAVVPESHEPHVHAPIRRVAAFLTQVIANARQVPQTRARRRADPADVIAGVSGDG